MIKIEAFRFFSQKSTNCPIGRSSLFEPCPMNRYIMHASSTPWKEFLEIALRFSHLLVSRLIKGLSSN